MKISVIGLGKLGLCTAACFAASGHAVTGFDSDGRHRDRLKSGDNPIDETGLPELLFSAGRNLDIVDSYDAAVESSDVILIIVPTPSEPDGRFNNEHLMRVLQGVSPAIQRRSSFCVVDIVSTVMPGSCDNLFRPYLEKATGKRCGIDFGLVYNPEFIALGSVIRNFLNPDLVLIGASDPRSGAIVRELYQSTCKSSPVISVMSLVNAEITKISLNCYVTMKISYANRLAAICEGVPGADIDVITAAIGADSRVGGKGLKGGLGFGGPCFPRDNLAFQAFATEFDGDPLLSCAVVAVNDSIPRRFLGKIASHCPPAAKVALLGLAYKPDTHIIEESHSIMLAKLLAGSGYRLALHDPKALGPAENLFRDAAEYARDPYQCLAGCSAAVLLTDWPEYRNLDWGRVAGLMQPGALVIDSWRVARESDLSAFTYHPIGVGIRRLGRVVHPSPGGGSP